MEKQERVLVIHPDDRSTDFLKPIYSDITGATVITGGISKEEVREMIKQHDRIIMLGHGSPNGLFSIGKFTSNDGYLGMIIDHTMVGVLSNKKNNMYIWCHANQFVNYFQLKGFYSGMFISEYGEAYAYQVPTLSGDVEESNDVFAGIVGKYILNEAKVICETTKTLYDIPGNLVNKYNKERLNWN
jgi:hypothetical protein